MRTYKTFVIIMIFLVSVAFKADKPAYQFFNSKGQKVKYKKVLNAAKDADVVFFGELHDNPICHWLQLEITKNLYQEKEGSVIMGAEMFEADNQLIIDEYLSGTIREKNFEKEAKLWPNYKTDYKPLMEYARENRIPFIATNIPRRYASIVHKGGFEALNSLSERAKSYIAPLPVKYDPELKGYKSMLEMMGGMGHGNENLPKAQAIKDATMAHFILENLSEGTVFIHYNGSYHSNDFEGIVWYIKQDRPDLKVMTIASTEQAQIDSLKTEKKNVADFILAIPEDMIKTY